MKISFTRKEVLAMLKHMAEQEGDYEKSILLEIDHSSGIGMATHIIEEDGSKKEITDYGAW